MADCQWTDRVSVYHDGELSETDAAAVERHLAQCAGCRDELRRYRRLSRMIGDAEMPELPATVIERIKDNIEWEGNPIVLRLARRMTGIAAAVLIGSALWLVTSSSMANPAPVPVHEWETAAVSPVADVSASNSRDTQLAEWMVADLSQK